MRDDFLSRDWGEQHASLTRAIEQLVRSTMAGIARLNARQYEAPWQHRSKGHCG